MKINRKHLRRLIESVINEENPKYTSSAAQTLVNLIKNPKIPISKKEKFVEIVMKDSKVSQEEKKRIQQLLDTVKENDKEMLEVIKEEEENVIQMYKDAVDQEKRWANYLFKDGSIIGLNDKLLHNYVEFIANKRMRAVGLEPIYDHSSKNNPLPWTEHWLNSRGLQNAPQETEIESYVVGGIKQDVKKDTFEGFKL